MAFLIYRRTVTDGSVRYERLQPLKLAGADGLIARHVKTLADPETASWKLPAAALLQMAASGPSAEDSVVLFDASGPEGTSICLYELACIHGSCRDTTTQIALDFSIVADQEAGGESFRDLRNFVVPAGKNPKRLGETLALSGGPGGGTWKWTAPGMNLGTTVVQPHAHGGGEPCGHCTCGRKAPA